MKAALAPDRRPRGSATCPDCTIVYALYPAYEGDQSQCPRDWARDLAARVKE